MRVTVLGSGDAFGSGGRLHSGYLVEANGTTALVECGPSILQGLKQAGIEPSRIDAVVLSHLHGDHFGGVPFLFMEYRYESPRTRPLTVYGPRGTKTRVDRLFAALYEKSSEEARSYPLDYVDLHADTTTSVGGLEISAFAVHHVPELDCLAFRIDGDGKRLLYSGDAAWMDAFATWARDVDVFICECSTYETRLDIHVSYPEIAARAAELGCKRLVLSHLGSEVLARLSELTLECARDGMVIEA